MSQLGWVDFSSTDREQVSKILSMLREPGTLDELGIGQIRDAFADLLFPGFSTIQTRAKYLITVPRIFRDYHLLQSKEKKRNPLLKYLKEKENEVAQHLVDKHENDEEGIIGSTMVGKGGVNRRPSTVYWNAFRQFGIIKVNASLNEFCHEYEQDNAQKHYSIEHDDGVDDEEHFRLKNKVEVPSYDSLWLDELSMDLTKEEAEFLYLYIMQSNDIADSIPSQLFTHGLLDTALEDEYQSIDALTLLIINDENISPTCKNTLKLASEFSLAMEGPHIRYNIVIARKNGFEHNVEKYQKEYTKWLERVEQEKLFYVGSAEKWLDAAAKDYTRPFKPQTVNFIKEWSRHIQEKSSNEELDFFVEKQALRNKGSRSLLKKKIVKDGWIGIRRLDYRWSSAIKILRDIYRKGLKVLEPNKHRFDYGEQLNAPDGFELDAAIATTYSLDLSALLMISVALGFKDTLEGDLSGEKLVILEAISGLKEKLKVFYQKGNITVPTEYNSLFTLLEPCVSPVIPEGGEFSSFHPKVWLLRYVESGKKRNQKIRYKLIVLTRNLTFDKSWDIAASLDGTLMDAVQTKDSQNGWIDFFLSLLDNEKDFLHTKVLTKELPYIKWKMFKSMWSEKLLPGGGKFGQPLFFNKFDHILVVSPFIKDAGGQIKALDWLDEQLPEDGDKLLFSREEELNAIGEDALRDWKCFAINSGVVEGEEKIEEGSELHNLHAKLIVTERGGVTDWHMGSANATSAALGNKLGESPRNSEFMLRFSGPTELFGLDSLLEQWVGEEEGRGLFVPHVFKTVEDIDNTEERNTLRSIIYELIKAKWNLIATIEHPGINYTLTLEVESDVLFEKMEKKNITIQVDQLAIQGGKKRLEHIMQWSNVELTQISAFLPIYLSLPNKEEEEKVVIQVPIKLEGGDIRHQGILKKMLDSNEKILNYIRMLLNPEADKNEWLEYDGNREMGTNEEIDIFATDTPLFEQLMYTASRHPEALERIESLIKNLEKSDIEIPQEFSALWEHFRIGVESND